jgi:site-specific DNA-methyltransferase (adenine-specific)
MKKYQVKTNNMELEIIQDDDGKFITPYLCIEDWGKFGTALKPSFEPIIVARKPFKGSLVDNVIEYGVGGINIDECRVGNIGGVKKINIEDKSGSKNCGFGCNGQLEELNKGRFPANTILTYDETDFDEVCGGFPNTKGGTRHNTCERKSEMTSFGFQNNTRNEFNDSGSASRYFYCAKASAKDRNEGLDIEIEEYHLKDDTPEEIKNKILNSLTS